MIDIEYARQVLEHEGKVVSGLSAKISESFQAAGQAIIDCRGRLIITGMGKAGIIAQKIAATFSSTGTPALYLHPAEAVHGDLGAVQDRDIVLALSNSGTSEEIIRLIPTIRRIGARVIAITSSVDNTLAGLSDIVIAMGRIEEACPLKLAPSASTAAMLAMGDALALAVLKARGFTREDYALYHPAGELGRKLLKVEELMRSGERCPQVSPDTPVIEVLTAMTGPRAGAACVVDDKQRLLGFFTDGDFRRHYAREKFDASNAPVSKYMTAAPTTVAPERLATEALALMRGREFDELPVVDSSGRVVGLLDVQDLLAAGLV